MALPFSHAQSAYLDNYDRELFNQIKRRDAVISILFAKGSIKRESSGGPNFLVRVRYGKNPNVGWDSPTAEVPTNLAELNTMASVPQKFIRGSIALNMTELDRANKQGEWALGDYIKEQKAGASDAWVQEWANVLRQSAPGALHPLTLLPSAANVANGILAPQAKASQTATTAGISRSEVDANGTKWWTNAYTNDSVDISTEAGRSRLRRFIGEMRFGNTKDDGPDFGLTNDLTIADLTDHFLEISSRFNLAEGDSLLAKLNLRGVIFENASLVADPATQLSGKIALLNSRSLFIKYLSASSPQGMSGGSQENWDQQNNLGSIPVDVLPFQRDINSFHWISLFKSVASLIPASLREQGLADNVV